MKLVLTMGASTLTWPMKMKAMVSRLVRQMAATGVLFGPFCQRKSERITKGLSVTTEIRKNLLLQSTDQAQIKMRSSSFGQQSSTYQFYNEGFYL